MGSSKLTPRIAAHTLSVHGRVLDVGAGRGYEARLWPADATYVALDIDHRMLAAGHQKRPVQAEATRLPLLTDSVDMVLCKQISHHIPDTVLDDMFDEIWRVLRPSGQFLFMDAVKTGRLASRVLWHYDRGSHPRSEPDLLERLQRRFRIVSREAYWNFHTYLLFALEPLEVAVAVRPGPSVPHST